jgi:hypothetical protein
MSRLAVAVAWLVIVCLGSPLRAQSARPAADSTDVLVLDYDFATGGEIVRVFLNDMQVYRAELSSQDVTLEIRGRFSGMKALRVYPILDSRSSSGSTVVEIYPDQDGEYEIRPISIQGSRISTRLRLYRDLSESRRRMAVVNQPGWELGVELGGGWHSGFAQTSVTPAIGSESGAGTDIEGCLSARSAPKVPRFGMCVLGVSHQSQTGAPNLLWVYTEPRLGVLRPDRQGYSSWEMGALFRFGVGINSSGTPRVLAPGLFLSRHMRRSRQGTSWTLQLSYSLGFFKGFKRPQFSTEDPFTPKSHRVSFGVAWYK